MNIGKFKHHSISRPYVPTAGNMAVVVVVDSTAPYQFRCFVHETVIIPLQHFGIPFRLLDLAIERPSRQILAGCAGVILAQDNIGARLTNGEFHLIADAVRKEGIGLINLDWDLRRYPTEFLQIFGFSKFNPDPCATNLFYVPASSHYICGLHRSQTFEESDKMVRFLIASEYGSEVETLVDAVAGKEQLIYIRHLVPGGSFEPDHFPVVFATRWGKGRAVQYTFNPRLWRQQAMGHPGGLSDVFWRSIIWAVRKPFVANIIPPLVGMEFDDCSGRHDFKYLDICTQYEYKPLVSLFIDKIKEKDRSILQRKVKNGEATVNTHGGGSYYDRLYYNFGRDEWSEEELKKRFEREDKFYRWLGVCPSRCVIAHAGELGHCALPFLKQRGRTFITATSSHVGEHRVDQFAEDGFWPFNSSSYFYDNLPQDKDFYILGSCQKERTELDFLTSTTPLLRESQTVDVERAAERGAEVIRLGLATASFAVLQTHEQKLGVMTLGQWEEILSRISQMTSGYKMIFSSLDDIVQRMKAKDSISITSAETSNKKRSITLIGNTESEASLSVFTEKEGQTQRSYLAVPCFETTIRLS